MASARTLWNKQTQAFEYIPAFEHDFAREKTD